MSASEFLPKPSANRIFLKMAFEKSNKPFANLHLQKQYLRIVQNLVWNRSQIFIDYTIDLGLNQVWLSIEFL